MSGSFSNRKVSNFKGTAAIVVLALFALLLAVSAQAVCTSSCLTINARFVMDETTVTDTKTTADTKAAAGTESETQVLKIAAGKDTINLGEKAVPLGELKEKPEVSKRTLEAEKELKQEGSPSVRINKHKRGEINIQIGNKNYAEEGKDVVRFGQDIVVAESDSVDGNVVAIGGCITVNGKVTGDCVAIGGCINIGPKGVVGGDGVSVGGTINREPGSVLEGDEVVTGGNIPKWLFRGGWPRHGLPGLRLAGLALAVGKALVVLFVAWLIVLISRERVKVTSNKATSNMLASFGVGLLTIILTPIAMVLLCITLIGIPVAILLPFALIIVGLFGYTAVGLALGHRLFGSGSRTVSVVEATILGVLLMEAIPIVGKLIGLPGGILWGLSIPVRIVGYAIIVCAFLIGLGATILSKFGQPQRFPFQGGVMPPGYVPPAPGMPVSGVPASGMPVPPGPGTPGPGIPAPPTSPAGPAR
jgi:hypothetical protein